MCNSCNCVDCSPPGSSVHGTLQARVLEWGAISFSGGSSQFRNLTLVSCTAGRFFTNRAMNEAQSFAAKSLQSCPTLCSPIDGSPPGSAVPGILHVPYWRPFICCTFAWITFLLDLHVAHLTLRTDQIPPLGELPYTSLFKLGPPFFCNFITSLHLSRPETILFDCLFFGSLCL